MLTDARRSFCSVTLPGEWGRIRKRSLSRRKVRLQRRTCSALGGSKKADTSASATRTQQSDVSGYKVAPIGITLVAVA